MQKISLSPFMLCCVLLCSQIIPGGASAQDDRSEIGRIMSYLAGDEMKGRGNFTAQNEQAADFIAREFAGSGLRPLPGEDSLKVNFTLNRRKPVSTSVTLNGAVVPDSEVFVSTHAVSVSMNGRESLPLFRMGDKFDRAMMRNKSGLILIPRQHKETFGRYRRFMAETKLFLGEPDPGVLVSILTDEDSTRAVTIGYTAVADTPTLTNVVGVLPGKRSGESVLFSAHYDHLGVISPVDGDSIANGANDNASGTTAVISLAKYFGSRGTPERTLIFVAFAAEELGGFGSRFLSEKLDPESIVAMLNMEMVGTVSKFGPRSFWITGYERSDLGPMVTEELRGSAYSAFPDPYPEQNLFFRSDNATFARQGVPAHSLSTDPIDIDSVYHTVNDEIGAIDFGHMADIVKGVALGVSGIVDGRQTPRRIKLDEK